MGFWSNFSKVFGSKEGARQAEQPTGGRIPAHMHAKHGQIPTGWVKEGGTPIHADQAAQAQAQAKAQARARAQKQRASGATGVAAPPQARGGAGAHQPRMTTGTPVPAQPRMIDPNAPRNAQGELINPPRTKQELFEELHRNYREVLHLVRKVNTHLDREQARGDRMLRVAAQVEAVLPKLQALTNMPGEINEHAAKLHAELVEAMRDTNQSDEQRTKRLESALGRISETMHEGAEGQANLNRTMAAFRDRKSVV